MRFMLVVFMLMTLIACGAKPSATYNDIVGSWQVVSLNGQPIIADRALTLDFGVMSNSAQYVAGGFAGCNDFVYQQVSMTGNSLTLSESIMHAIGCSSEILQQENSYHAALRATQRFSLENGRLILYDNDLHELITLTRASTILEGTWILGTMNTKGINPTQPITLEINGDQIQGFAGCNHYSGTIKLGFTPNIFQVLSLEHTEIACTDQVVMETEVAYLKQLKNSQFFQYTNALTLFDANQNTLIFEKR